MAMNLNYYETLAALSIANSLEVIDSILLVWFRYLLPRTRAKMYESVYEFEVFPCFKTGWTNWIEFHFCMILSDGTNLAYLLVQLNVYKKTQGYPNSYEFESEFLSE